MGFTDLIRELRTGKADPKKAAAGMKILGWVCLFGGVWNFVLPQVAPFKEAGFRLPAGYPVLALLAFFIIGALSLVSARGIRDLEPWGRRLAQGAVGLLLLGVVLFALALPSMVPLPVAGHFRLVFPVFFLIALAQFALPAWFGIRYLGRLPVRDPFSGDLPPRLPDEPAAPSASPDSPRYKDSPFPFGILGTFLVLMALPMAAFFIGRQHLGPEGFALVFLLGFIFIFVGPTLFNYLPSPFAKGRRQLAAFTGGGSIYLFNGSWPFFRLVVYDDALEIRVMLHRFLVPYDRMEDLPEKVGFFTTGLFIRSDLPGVPSRIRFSGFGMKNILRVLNDARAGRHPDK